MDKKEKEKLKKKVKQMMNNAIKNGGLQGSSSFMHSYHEQTEMNNEKETNEETPVQKEQENIDEVEEATSFTSEEVHGGKEATGDIKDSPNASDDGENDNNQSSPEKTKDNENKDSKEETKEENESDDKENVSDNCNQSNKSSSSELEDSKNEHVKDVSCLEDGENTEDETEAEEPNVKSMSIEETLEALQNKANNVSDKIMDAFREVLKRERSFSKSFGHSKWDINKICNHLITNREYLIVRDRYSNIPKKASIFIDTSASMYDWIASIQKAIRMLISSGYKVDLYGIGNGFLEESPSLHDDEYHVRDQLRKISADANIPDICRPNIEDGIKICNSSEIAIMIADFDGLSSIVKMAMGCSKIPYLFSIENRYSWEDPTEHNWVDPDFCEYPDHCHRVFDIVTGGYDDDDDYYDDDYYDDDDYDDDDYDDEN